MLNPLEQFKITLKYDFLYKYFDITISIISILLLFTLIIISYTIWIIMKRNSKAFYILLYLIDSWNKQFINILTIKNSNYLPFITYNFIYILLCNIIGLIPYSFTYTSQVIITILWSTSIMIVVTYIGLAKHNYRFIYLFIPNGVPIILKPYIAIIEIISYLSRVLSLSIRLSTNMIAGHTLIYIISWFGYKTSLLLKISIIIPTLFLILLEFGVCIIQAYVFSLLIATYIRDSIELH